MDFILQNVFMFLCLCEIVWDEYI